MVVKIYQDREGNEPFTDRNKTFNELKIIGMITSGVNTMRNYRDFKDYHIEKLRDPEEARTYLSVALEEYEQDGDTEAFLLALRDVAEAQGGLMKLAQRTKLNRQNLYKALSRKGNPRLQTIEAILHELGFRLSVEPVKAAESIKTSK